MTEFPIATQILYAFDKFTTNDIKILRTFLQRIGGQAQHLRHVGYEGLGNKEALQEIAIALKPAKHLFSFGVTHELTDAVGWCRLYSAKQLMKLLPPLLIALSETRKDDTNEEKRAVSNIFSIHPGYFYRWYGYKPRSDIQTEAEDFEAEMRALIEKQYA